jgi:chromate transporter
VSGLARAERADIGAASTRTMRGLFLYFLRLGSAGFGGPIALAGYMRRDLVEERGWYSDAEYQQGLAIAQTMPGPLAAQLAMWLGYLERGARGALLVALPFIVPPFYSSPPSRPCMRTTRGCHRCRASSSASDRR